jgi:HAE1 family hydrophobic/amphiphilic exporter-1
MSTSISGENNNKYGFTHRFVNYFLRNTQLTILLFLILVIGGVGAFLRLRVEGFPEIQIPAVVVTTVVPGAGPDTVRSIVSQPIETAVKNLDGVKETSSTSQANFSVVVINYDSNVDVNLAIQEARTKIESLALPEGISPQVVVSKINRAPFYIAVSGGTDLLSLRKQSEILKTELQAIDSVASVNEISGIEANIYIELGPQYQSPQIIDQIRAANVGFPLGETIIDGKRVPVVAKSSVRDLEDIRAIRINLPDGSSVRLADIASVYLGVDYGNKVHRVGFLQPELNQFKIQPSLLYEVTVEKGTDLLAINDQIKEAVAKSNERSDVADFVIVLNMADRAQQQVDEIIAGAIGSSWGDSPIGYVGFIFGGAWLLLIIMLLFLDWRTAIVSLLSIPLSFLFTFLVLAILGIQLNTLVLFSLVLVLGLIVDPAIVVLESIRRYMDIGYKGDSAVLRAVDVVGLGLFVSVLTSLIVFLPFAVVSGTFGQLIVYIPYTVFPAIIASYFIPLIFLTWLGSRYIKTEKGQELKDEDDVHTLWSIARSLMNINRYIVSRRWASILTVVAGLVVPIAITVVLFSTDHIRQVQFSQPDDSHYIQLSIPRGANQTYRDLQMTATGVEEVLKPFTGEIKSFFYQDFGGSLSNQTLSVFIELQPLKNRSRKSSEITKDIQTQLKAKFGDKALASELAAGPPSNTLPVSVQIFDENLDNLRFASEKIAAELRSYAEVDLVNTDFDNQSFELDIVVDPTKAAAAGLSAPAVYGQLAGLLGENTLFRLEQTAVIVRVPEDVKPATKDALLSSVVFGTAGPVRLGDVAVINETVVPSSVRSLGGERYALVSATVKDSRDAINVQRKITDWAKKNTSTLGVNDRAFEQRAGVNEFEKSFQELFLAIFAALVLTYVALVIFFRSFVQPFIILYSVPLILIGVFPALALFNKGQFGFLETIGILMVIGIVENVGIFMIDYANRKVSEGVNKSEAIVLASGIRLRPITLTNITTLAGLLPLAVFSPFWRGLALVVIFGILSSGILSLFTTPVLYKWLTRVKKSDGEALSVEPITSESVSTNPASVDFPGSASIQNYPTQLPPNLPTI